MSSDRSFAGRPYNQQATVPLQEGPLPDFPTVQFGGYPGLWVSVTQHERLREAVREISAAYDKFAAAPTVANVDALSAAIHKARGL